MALNIKNFVFKEYYELIPYVQRLNKFSKWGDRFSDGLANYAHVCQLAALDTKITIACMATLFLPSC